jgi:hypothetical protein
LYCRDHETGEQFLRSIEEYDTIRKEMTALLRQWLQYRDRELEGDSGDDGAKHGVVEDPGGPGPAGDGDMADGRDHIEPDQCIEATGHKDHIDRRDEPSAPPAPGQPGSNSGGSTARNNAKRGRKSKWGGLKKMIAEADEADSDDAIAKRFRKHNPKHPDRKKVDARKVQQVRADMKRRK